MAIIPRGGICACSPTIHRRGNGRILEALRQTVGTGDSPLTLSLSRALAARNIGRLGTRGRGDRAGAWGYPERLRDDAGLKHVGARYYDAQVGRFVIRDTVLSEHPYLYCEHDAVNAVDPSGHFSIKAWWFHVWIEKPGGSIGFWPGSPSPFWSPGLFQASDPYQQRRSPGVVIAWLPWPAVDRRLADVAVGVDGRTVGVYTFPFIACAQGAFALALYVIREELSDWAGRAYGGWEQPLGP